MIFDVFFTSPPPSRCSVGACPRCRRWVPVHRSPLLSAVALLFFRSMWIFISVWGFRDPFLVSEIRLKFPRPFEVWDSFEFQWFEVSVIRDVRARDCSDFFFAWRLQCSSPCEQDQLPGQSTAQGSPALEMRLVGTFQWCAQLSQAGVDRLHRRLLDEFHLVCFRASSGLQPSESSASRVSVWPRRDVPCSSNEVLPRLTKDLKLVIQPFKWLSIIGKL